MNTATKNQPPKPEPRSAIGNSLDAVRDATDKALITTKDSAREVARRTAEGIEANPLAVVVGGVALGVLAGALLPRTEQESKLLGNVGQRLNASASGAVQAARDAGKSELEGLGLSKDAARDQVGKLLEGVMNALTAAASAAVAGVQKPGAPKQ